MALSWNEIKSRAVQFSKEWENEASEDAEAKSFLDNFFNVFGMTRRRMASFESKVHKNGERDGYIDMLWKGNLLVEMKSKGRDLDKAYAQAIDYFPGLKENDLPKYILVCDFERFRLYDIEENTHHEFHLKDLYKNVKHFGFIAGYQKQVYKPEDPVNIEAAELMGKLHDMLKAVGYTGHQLEVYLVRLLFCLFADDTTIFEKGIFEDLIRNNTRDDGSDLADRIAGLFEVLNTDSKERLTNIDETLNAFPYVNGKLFEENLHRAAFDCKMRKILLECCALNWGKISPAIFGSMFQSVMNPQERRSIGAHYTSEKNILKLIKPLFLDDLHEEFEKVKGSKNKLVEFHKKLSTLKFLDPACGCGNFLVITYRELRLLEIEILRVLYKTETETVAILVENALWIDVDQFFGIEYEEWPAQIAQVAMWLMDHQMNMKISEEFGEYYVRLPLKKSATIVPGNALSIDWESIVSKENLSFILGNPPFIGSKMMKQEQRDEIVRLFGNSQGSGILDYVTGWYIKAAQYIQSTQIKVAFVSTNSISQGEQVSVLWKSLLYKHGIKIHFAHRTFKWRNEAKGNAAVYCVIIGFANYDISEKLLFEYEDIRGEAHVVKVNNINPYLIGGKEILIDNRSTPLCSIPKMNFGNMPLDGGHLLLNDDEKDDIIIREPPSRKYIKPLISASEFLNRKQRWCLWLVNATPNEIKNMPLVMARIAAVKRFRLESKAPSTLEIKLN